MKMPQSFDRGTIAGRATIAGRNVAFSSESLSPDLIRNRYGSRQENASGQSAGSAGRRRRRMEDQRKSVHAVAQAGRLRPVVEDVTEMAAAAAAVNFGAQHPKGAVLGLADGVLERLIEARPAGAAFEFRLGGE